MIKLMEKPNENRPYCLKLSSCHNEVMAGHTIRDMFFDSKSGKKYIPKVLVSQNWEPENDNLYLVWWYHDNPSDSADFGNDIIYYIETVEDKIKWISAPSTILDNIDNAINVLFAFRNKHNVEYRESDTDEWRLADYHDILRYLSDINKYQARIVD